MHLAVIADVHGNLPALQAILTDIDRRGIADVVNLGDCVSGPLWPQETFDLLMQRGFPTVRGNHDRWVATLDAEHMGPSDRFAAGQLSTAARAWLGALPTTADLHGDVHAFHARPDDDNAYLLERVVAGHLVSAPQDVVRRRLGATQARFVLCGHSHQPGMVTLTGGPTIVNPGSVGCPAYADAENIPHVSQARSPHARYAIITVAGRIAVELIAVDYDWDAAAARATSNGRPDWAQGLATGFMPDA